MKHYNIDKIIEEKLRQPLKIKKYHFLTLFGHF